MSSPTAAPTVNKFEYGENLFALVLGAVGVGLFFLPLSSIIIAVWNFISPPRVKILTARVADVKKRTVQPDDDDDPGKTNFSITTDEQIKSDIHDREAWNTIEHVALALRDKHIPGATKRGVGSLCESGPPAPPAGSSGGDCGTANRPTARRRGGGRPTTAPSARRASIAASAIRAATRPLCACG